jgi:O-antigen ligase
MEENYGSLLKISRFFVLLSFVFCVFASFFISFLIASMVFYYIWIFSSGEIKRKFVVEKIDFLLFLLFFLVLVRSFFTPQILTSLAASFSILFYILLFLFFRNFPFQKVDFFKIFRFVAISLVFVNLFALIHYFIIKKPITLTFFGNKIYQIIPFQGNSAGAPLVSILDHPTGGGIILSLISNFILFWLIASWKDEKNKWKILYTFSIIISYFCIFLTSSRSGLLNILLGILLASILFKKYKIFLLGFSFIVILLILIPNQKLKQTFNEGLDSYNIPPRILQIEAGTEYFKENPLFGIGLMQFKERFQNYHKKQHFPGYFLWGVEFLHNGYLSILVECGVTGFLLVFSYIIIRFILILKDFLKKENDRWLKIMGLYIILWFLLDSIFNAHLYVVPIGSFFWIGLGISQNASLKSREL